MRKTKKRVSSSIGSEYDYGNAYGMWKFNKRRNKS